jgi:hypothetical protein
MAYDQEIGTAGLRAEVVEKTVKGFATATYKFKQALTISSTNAWKNTFFRETSTALTAKSTFLAIKGLPRGASIPQGVETWEEVNKRIEKYAIEGYVYWEDILTNDIDVQARTMFRIAEAVTKAVDDEIFAQLSESLSPTNIQEVDLLALAANQEYAWNGVSAAVIDDLMQASQKIAEYNYDVSNLMCFISPKDKRSIMNYLAGKGAQFPNIGNEIASNGKIMKVAGIQLIESNSVTASYALVVVPKICATWKEAYPLSTDTLSEAFKGVRIRACELGVTQVTDPKAIVLISGTQK